MDPRCTHAFGDVLDVPVQPRTEDRADRDATRLRIHEPQRAKGAGRRGCDRPANQDGRDGDERPAGQHTPDEGS